MYSVPLTDPNLFSYQHCPKHNLTPWLENLWNTFSSSPLKGIRLMPINCRVFLGKHKSILRKFSLSLQDTCQAPHYLIPGQWWQGFRLFRFGSFFAPATCWESTSLLMLTYTSLGSTGTSSWEWTDTVPLGILTPLTWYLSVNNNLS